MWGWGQWMRLSWNARTACARRARVISRGNHDSKGNNNAPTLKGELRRLYKLIHPDLLHNQPVQQETNQKSFQLLQEYLSAAKDGHDSNRFAYHFEFFIPGRQSGGSLEKVTISLPPPQKWGLRYHGSELRSATRRDIKKLFEACGLTLSLPDIDVHQDYSLPVLFQEASELQRQANVVQLSFQHQASLIRSALFVGRGVKVLFPDPVHGNLALEVTLMERLAKAIDSSPGVSINGFTFVIGERYGVDHLGRLCLKSEDRVQLWIKYLHQADLVEASARRVAARAREMQEKRVARILGVQLVIAGDSLVVHQDYSDFLSRIEASKSAVTSGPGHERFADLPVRVARVDVPEVDEDMGCVTIPVTQEFAAVCSALEEHGVVALRLTTEVRMREARLENLRGHVLVNLRLRRLIFDRQLRSDQLMSACTRLSSHAHKLRPFMEDLSVCISDEHRLPSEDTGYFLHMKWNFSMESF